MEKIMFEKVSTCIVLAEMAACVVIAGLCYHEGTKIMRRIKKNKGSNKEEA